jgi:hypothetical protein
LVGSEDVGEIDLGAVDGGDGDAFVGGDVAGVERAVAVNFDAFEAASPR